PYFILRLPRPPSSTLLPYTTLFRSQHPVDVKDDTRLSEAVGKGALMVNSTHHQAVDALGEDLRVSAVAPDGVIEAIESTRYPFRSEEHTSELQSRENLVCRLLLETK